MIRDLQLPETNMSIHDLTVFFTFSTSTYTSFRGANRVGGANVRKSGKEGRGGGRRVDNSLQTGNSNRTTVGGETFGLLTADCARTEQNSGWTFSVAVAVAAAGTANLAW